MTTPKRVKITKRDIREKEIDYSLLADEVKDDIQRSLDNTNVDLTSLDRDIIPKGSGSIDLGSPDKKFNKAYIQELHLDENTLYIGDTPILGTEQDSIMIKADAHQSITVKTEGTGKSNIISANGVELFTEGLNSDIKLTASGSGSRVLIGADNVVQFNSPESTFAGDVSINNTLSVKNLNVSGDVSALGEKFLVDAEIVRVKDNIIEINKGEAGEGVTAGRAGLKVDRGDAPDYLMVFDETTKTFSVGMENDLEILATRNYVDSKEVIPTWENVLNKPSTFTPSLHTHSWDDLSLIPKASLSGEGVVQLSSSINSTSTSLAATASAVKEVYDLVNSKWTFDENAIKAIKVNNAANADKVGGFTVGTNVPANAVFTDTVYTHPSSHPASMITGLHACATSGVAGSVAWANVSSKPSTFAPSTHSHGAGDLPSATTSAKGVVQLSSAVNSTSTSLAATASAVKAAYDVGNHSHPYAASSHTHAWSQVTSIPATASRWPAWSEVTGKPSTFAPSSHTHSYEPVLAANRKRQIFVQSSTPSGASTGDLWVVT